MGSSSIWLYEEVMIIDHTVCGENHTVIMQTNSMEVHDGASGYGYNNLLTSRIRRCESGVFSADLGYTDHLLMTRHQGVERTAWYALNLPEDTYATFRS